MMMRPGPCPSRESGGWRVMDGASWKEAEGSPMENLLSSLDVIFKFVSFVIG